ncbi:restriction endonuclease subunit S [Pectobacterium versatile]|uniref:restriction endonuclease subunit S n=1 Tax=Pectobacterium versatile TaxID=2488639 RepID=UPI0032EFF00A
MSEFKDIELGIHLKLISGFPFSSSLFSNEGFPLIRIRDILTSRTETCFRGAYPPGYVVKKGDILVGMDGDFHVVKWRGNDALLNQRVLKVDVQNESVITLDYLFHWLGPFIKKINEVTAATTVKHLSIKDLTKAKAKFPEVGVQKKIAAIFTAFDTAIENTEALIAKYQQIKAGLMNDLFTRGVLPNGQLRPPRSVAPELYQETAIGWFPREWKVNKLGAMAKIVSGVTLGSKESPTDTIEVPYLRVANVQDGYLNLTEIKKVCVSRKTLEYLRLLPGDVLMNEGGDFDKLGRGAVWAGEVEDCIHQNHVFRVRTDWAVLRPNYLAYFSESSFGKKYFLLSSKQSTNLASINSTQLNLYPIALPPCAEQDKVILRISASNSRIDALKAEVEKLSNQKRGLMQDLLTGKVAVQVDELDTEVTA